MSKSNNLELKTFVFFMDQDSECLIEMADSDDNGDNGSEYLKNDKYKTNFHYYLSECFYNKRYGDHTIKNVSIESLIEKLYADNNFYQEFQYSVISAPKNMKVVSIAYTY